jgi:hypothetical protein
MNLFDITPGDLGDALTGQILCAGQLVLQSYPTVRPASLLRKGHRHV